MSCHRRRLLLSACSFIVCAAVVRPRHAEAAEPASVVTVPASVVTVQADPEGESFEEPPPPESLSIAMQWALEPPRAPSPECDGCLRLTTTPRGPRPPVHSYVFTEVAGATADVRGGYGGHILAKHVLLGGGGFGLVRYRPLAPADGMEVNAQRDSLGVGGLFGALLPLPHAMIRPVAALFMGVGNLRYKIDSGEPYPETKVFVVAPQFTLEAETTNLTRIGVGASYRVIGGSPIAEQLTRNVSGPTAFGFVLFGFR
jgi:hypothetical protein